MICKKFVANQSIYVRDQNLTFAHMNWVTVWKLVCLVHLHFEDVFLQEYRVKAHLFIDVNKLRLICEILSKNCGFGKFLSIFSMKTAFSCY